MPDYQANVLAIEDLGDLVQLVVFAILIVGSMLASWIAKARDRQKSDESPAEDAEVIDLTVAPPPVRPSKQRQPAQPVRRAELPMTLSPSQRRSGRTAAPAPRGRGRVPRPAQPGLRTARPAKLPQRLPAERDAESVTPHLEVAPLPSGQLRRGEPEQHEKRKRHRLVLGRGQLRRAVIYSELLGKPISLREQHIW